MMMGAASRGLVVLACLALVAGAHATKSKSDAFQKDLEALAEDIHQKYNASFSLAVADLDGNVWPVAKGWARPDKPMTTESIFPAGSTTKPLTTPMESSDHLPKTSTPNAHKRATPDSPTSG